MARLPFRFHYPAPRGQFRKEEKSHGTKETGQKAEEIEKARVHEDSYHNPQMVRQRRGRIIKARCLRVYDRPPGGAIPKKGEILMATKKATKKLTKSKKLSKTT